MAVAATLLIGCARPAPPPEVASRETRSYFMGFSIIPPKPDLNVALKSLGIWSKRADAAIMHMDVPWALLLAGTSPEDALRKDGVDLEHYYRSKHMKLVVTLDVTNGLGRESVSQLRSRGGGDAPSRLSGSGGGDESDQSNRATVAVRRSGANDQ
jgi:hypothetical protein